MSDLMRNCLVLCEVPEPVLYQDQQYLQRALVLSACLFILAVLIGIAVLICIFLVPNDVGVFSLDYLSSIALLRNNVSSNLWPMLGTDCFLVIEIEEIFVCAGPRAFCVGSAATVSQSGSSLVTSAGALCFSEVQCIRFFLYRLCFLCHS